jgi:pyrroloquinoline-quinone synthase
MADNADNVERLDAATAHRRLLDHPFYKAWAAGTLTTEDLRFYSTQYWRQVEAFPGYLSALADTLPDPQARRVVLDNLDDEVGDDHAGLWLRFAAALGAPSSEVVSTPPTDETARCVNAFQDAADNASAAFALGMLYAYESQTPEVAATKVEGLRSHYGIDGPAVEYFTLHGELDVEHSRELARALDEVATDDTGRAEADAGARAGAEAIWGLLDGVARERGIC